MPVMLQEKQFKQMIQLSFANPAGNVFDDKICKPKRSAIPKTKTEGQIAIEKAAEARIARRSPVLCRATSHAFPGTSQTQSPQTKYWKPCSKM